MSSSRALQPIANLPGTPGRQVKALRTELEKKDVENDALKSNIADLTKALDSLQLVKEKAAAAEKLFVKPAEADKKKKKKDPNAPAPAMTAYRYFCEDLKAKGQMEKSGEATRQMWKECQGDERKKFTDMASADKKRFEQENEVYQKSVNAKESEEKALEMYYEKQKQELAMEFFEAHLQAQNMMNEKKKKKEKDPAAPKRAMSAYLFFCQENRDSIVKKNPEKSATEIMKVLAEEWGKLAKGKGGKKGTKKYDTMAADDKIRYDKEKEEYDALVAESKMKETEEREMEMQKDLEEALKLLSEVQKKEPVPEPVPVDAGAEEKTKTVKAKKTKPAGPKRASSAYIYFTKENRAQIMAGMPETTTQQELLTEVGRQWRSLSDADKKKYVDMSAKDKERYQKELEQFKSQPEQK